MYHETVLLADHYTDALFSFQITRPQAFRFRSGEFTMLGLARENAKPLLRAYSIASPNWYERLEFFSIKVPGGPLTSRLAKITPGDEIILGTKSTGTLVLDALSPGKNLYLFSTGTGIAPFASIIRDLEVYERFEKVILTHGCRTIAELEYGRRLVRNLRQDEILAPLAQGKLIHFMNVTRQSYIHQGRITNFLATGDLYRSIGLAPITPQTDRVMICGSNAMIADLKKLFSDTGLQEGSVSRPGDFVYEKAFVS